MSYFWHAASPTLIISCLWMIHTSPTTDYFLSVDDTQEVACPQALGLRLTQEVAWFLLYLILIVG